MPAYQNNVEIDGLALSTKGFVYDSQNVDLITPIGLELQGLCVGKADFWQYIHTDQNAHWILDDV